MADWSHIHGEHDGGGAHGGMVLDGRHRAVVVVVCRHPWGGRRL